MPSETLSTPRAATPPEAKGASLRQDAAALAMGLERIRAAVLERLDKVEAALRQRTDAVPASDAELALRDDELKRHAAEIQKRQAEIQQRAADIEDAQRRLRADRDRWDNERTTLLEQLEHDRRLLAEAWERLEQEKLDHPDDYAGAAPVRNGAAERGAPRVVRAVVASDDVNPVAQDILRQFQAVRRDVRRSANGPAAG